MLVGNLAKSSIISLLFITSVASAQQQYQKRTPEERAQNQTKWMQKNLALTENQNAKVYDITLRYARENDDANTSTNQSKRAERRDIQKSKDEELKMVLTGEQYQKYQVHVQEMKEKMMERRANMRQEGN
jgi:protein CpxP